MNSTAPPTQAATVRAAEMNRQKELELGRNLAYQFYIMLRMCQVYSPDNDNFKHQLDKFHDLLIYGFEIVDSITLHISESNLFLNDVRLKMGLDGHLATRYIQETFEKLHVAGFRFENGILHSTLSTLFEALSDLDATDDIDQPTELGKKISETDIPFFGLVPQPTSFSSRSKPKTITEKRKLAKKNYFAAINAVGEITAQVSSKKLVNISKIKRIVHLLVDQILEDETYLMELTILNHLDHQGFAHSVNVCIYAVSVGSRLSFTRPELAELGFAAMVHDIGELEIPDELLGKQGELDATHREHTQEHPLHGVELLVGLMPIDRYAARAMLVAFEHHKNIDGSGYPYIERDTEINLHSQIVAICDYFDKLTGREGRQNREIRFDEVVMEMLKYSGTKFDPLLLKIFINVIGIYPTGTLLLLDTEELAVVISNNPEDIFRPRLRVIANRNGLFPKPIVVELTARESATKKYLRNIDHVVDPEKYDIDISRLVLGE